MSSPPLVSVIIPTYNRADSVHLSIDSALAQTYGNCEVIVVDDGSTDSTMESLSAYGDRITAIRQENGGPSVARNTGAAAAKGEIIAFLDSDDLWMPDKIARQVALLEKGGESVPCCICNAALVADGAKSVTTFEVSAVKSGMKEGFWSNPAPIIATRFILFNQVVAVRTEAFRRIGGFKPEMRLLEDYDLAFRLSLLGPWAFIEEPMVEKFNDTEGIGVVAMQDPLVHSRAWRGVLEGFLNELPAGRGDIRGLLSRALGDVRTEIRAVELGQRPGLSGRLAGKLLMFALRKRQALRRRSSGYPRINALSTPV